MELHLFCCHVLIHYRACHTASIAGATLLVPCYAVKYRAPADQRNSPGNDHQCDMPLSKFSKENTPVFQFCFELLISTWDSLEYNL